MLSRLKRKKYRKKIRQDLQTRSLKFCSLFVLSGERQEIMNRKRQNDIAYRQRQRQDERERERHELGEGVNKGKILETNRETELINLLVFQNKYNNKGRS